MHAFYASVMVDVIPHLSWIKQDLIVGYKILFRLIVIEVADLFPFADSSHDTREHKSSHHERSGISAF